VIPHTPGAGLGGVLVLAAAVLVFVLLARAFPRTRAVDDARTRRARRLLKVVGAVLVVAWIYGFTVLSYWRSRMPD
jgi:multisubunit Na+/H+ antiporter MnhB subunit